MSGDTSGMAPEAQELVSSSSYAGGAGPVLRKKLYDQTLADWSARYRKNKQHLDSLSRECDLARAELNRQQQETDERADCLRQLEDKYASEVLPRFQEARNALDQATHTKGTLQVQLSENRKTRTQLVREKKLLRADYERKHAEVVRMVEARDKLDAQLQQLAQQLQLLSGDRRKLERELDQVQHNLRQNTELADEVHTEIETVVDGIKDSLGHHMATSSSRLDTSIHSGEGRPHQVPS